MDDMEVKGSQRLGLERLRGFEALHYGMFLHYGMSTFLIHGGPDGYDPSGGCAPKGDEDSRLYAPSSLDVDQWISVARDSGMRYAVLTAKHHSGHCLWPSDHTDYHVGTSSDPTDVVEAFVGACARHKVRPCLYYASWDNHHRMGGGMPDEIGFGNAWTSSAYRDFQMRQVEELFRRYRPFESFWVDIPGFLGPEGRKMQYAQIAGLQPDVIVSLNQGFTTGNRIDIANAWPTDVCTMERHLPADPFGKTRRALGYDPWKRLDVPGVGQKDYYLPGEVCDSIGCHWFHSEDDEPRTTRELLAMKLLCRERGVNFLLNVPPDRTGRIPQRFVKALGMIADAEAKLG